MIRIFFFGIFFALLIYSPFVGTAVLNLSELLNPASLSHRIFVELRLPRVLLGFMAGASLGLAGLLFQNIFRNVLMTPYTLGVSSGAVLGAGIAIKLGLGTLLLGFGAVTLFGFAGAVTTVLLLVWLSRYLKRAEHESLLLLGIALSFFYTAALMMIFFVSNFIESHMLMRFTMGSLSVIGYKEPLIITASTLFLLLGMWVYRYELQLLALSDEQARLKGVNTAKITLILLLISSVAIAALVSLTGPIGFVGLVVPHIIRLIYKRDVSKLIVPTFLFGGLFLVACDTAARSIQLGSEIPIGVVTSLIGGPFFIYLILQNKQG